MGMPCAQGTQNARYLYGSQLHSSGHPRARSLPRCLAVRCVVASMKVNVNSPGASTGMYVVIVG